MKIGMWFYGAGTIFTGILDIAWGAMDGSHEPIQALGKNLPGQQMLAWIAGAWLIAAGAAMLWRRSERVGAGACGAAYLIFAALWLPRYYAGIHAMGWRIDVILGISFGLAQQVMLAAPAAIVYVGGGPANAKAHQRAGVAARWMLGLPPIFFGLLHLVGLRVFATIVPPWMGFGSFWAALTGAAFIVAGVAICAGKRDVAAARMLALMLLLFEGMVEIPPIFVRTHNQATWAAAAYNLVAIGACWIFAEFVAGGAGVKGLGDAESGAVARGDLVNA